MDDDRRTARLAGILFILGVVSLLTLGREYVVAGTPASSTFQTTATVLLAVRDGAGHVVLDAAVFPVGAVLFYSVLFATRLVPRWISGWGLPGAALYWVAGVGVLFRALTPLKSTHIALQEPLGVQELVLADWLIAKGFRRDAA